MLFALFHHRFILRKAAWICSRFRRQSRKPETPPSPSRKSVSCFLCSPLRSQAIGNCHLRQVWAIARNYGINPHSNILFAMGGATYESTSSSVSPRSENAEDPVAGRRHMATARRWQQCRTSFVPGSQLTVVTSLWTIDDFNLKACGLNTPKTCRISPILF
jgi:hypothetical protein